MDCQEYTSNRLYHIGTQYKHTIPSKEKEYFVFVIFLVFWQMEPKLYLYAALVMLTKHVWEDNNQNDTE